MLSIMGQRRFSNQSNNVTRSRNAQVQPIEPANKQSRFVVDASQYKPLFQPADGAADKKEVDKDLLHRSTTPDH